MTKQPKPEITRQDVTPDTPLRLDVAARLAFPDGSIGLSALRREAKRERLVVWRVANKDMTTLAEIDKMLEKCLVKKARLHASNGPEKAVNESTSAPSEFILRLAKYNERRRREGRG